MDGIHACGRIFFQKALTQGLIKNNPTEDFKIPEKQQSVKRTGESRNRKEHYSILFRHTHTSLLIEAGVDIKKYNSGLDTQILIQQ
jgi:hypothetical protein